MAQQKFATKGDLSSMQKAIEKNMAEIKISINTFAIQFTEEFILPLAKGLDENTKTVKDVQKHLYEYQIENRRLADQIRQHFDVVAENLHYDFRGSHKDKISQHEDRILVLEKHAGIK